MYTVYKENNTGDSAPKSFKKYNKYPVWIECCAPKRIIRRVHRFFRALFGE